MEPFPSAIDWKEVIRLSYQHKVMALAVDGLKESLYDPYIGLNENEVVTLKSLFESWFNDVEKTEQSYIYYAEVINTLCQVFHLHGLKLIILKGYGLSFNYPIPSHRGAGDIDIFLIDDNGHPATERGNQIVKEFLRLEVTKENDEHHSTFTFKNITVENHYELLKEYRIQKNVGKPPVRHVL